METIVRYSNRKLYSKTIKKYVNNNHLVELVRVGNDFQVIEHSTGNDITASSLTACLLDLKLSKGSVVKLIKEHL